MLSLKETEDGQATVVTINFDAGDYKGKQYRGEVAICDNPVCVCNTVDLMVREDGATAKESFPVALNFMGKTVNDNRKSQHATFDNALLDNMLESDWQLLYDLYVSAKTAYTEQANLETIDTYFPVEEIEKDGPLVALGQVLPFCEEITVELKGKTYWLDDQYCIKPHCDCQDAAITFLPIEHSYESSPTKAPTIMLDYNKSHWSTLDAGGYRKETIKSLASAINSDVRGKLRARHEKIRLLYKIYKKKHGIDQLRVPARSVKTVGRNDPCPCGSGKKYKRCCLNKESSSSIDAINRLV